VRSLLDRSIATDVTSRLHSLSADSPALWGKMTVSQMVSHCATAQSVANGDMNVPRVFVGYLFGKLIKPMALKDEAPMRKNSPTAPAYLVRGTPDFVAERDRFTALIDRFVAGGPSKVTRFPHAFFGDMTPDEWGILMFKHADHHLRQFGA
jgi:hypothetical protein